VTTKAQYPNPDYIAHVQAEFPAKGVATAEEGRCLWDAGYDVMDVRAVEEIDQNDNTPCPNPAPPGQAKGNRVRVVPLINAVRRYDSKLEKKVYIQTPNADFKNMVQKAFPNKDAKIMVACSDGRVRAIAALDALDEMGYTNIVGLRGGANLWTREWDAKMRRRNLPGKHIQNYLHSGDSPQLHGTGSQFQMADAQTYDDWRDETVWVV